MRLIYVNSSKVTKLEQKMNNSESFLLLLKNLLKCTYEVLLPSQQIVRLKGRKNLNDGNTLNMLRLWLVVGNLV